MKRIVTPLAVLTVLGIWVSLQMAQNPALTYEDGSPGGYTGSAGDGTNTCASNPICHDDANAKFTSGLGNIDLSNIPSNGYVPGQTYTITTSISKAGHNTFGFELTSEEAGGSGTKVGSFTSTDGNTKTVNSSSAITHTLSGNSGSGGSNSWTFDWTAPSAGTGQVQFQAAFNVANGNGQPGGDTIHIATAVIDEDPNTTVAPSASMLDEGTLSVYPTPAKERITLSGLDASMNTERILLHDLQGRVVQILQEGRIDESEASFSLDASLEGGTYLLEVQGEKDRRVEKLLIE